MLKSLWIKLAEGESREKKLKNGKECKQNLQQKLVSVRVLQTVSPRM